MIVIMILISVFYTSQRLILFFSLFIYNKSLPMLPIASFPHLSGLLNVRLEPGAAKCWIRKRNLNDNKRTSFLQFASRMQITFAVCRKVFQLTNLSDILYHLMNEFSEFNEGIINFLYIWPSERQTLDRQRQGSSGIYQIATFRQ